MLLLTDEITRPRQAYTSRQIRSMERVERMMEFIREHYAREISVAEIARSVALSQRDVYKRQQYTSFLWKGMLHFDFGPSLMSFPTPVGDILMTYLPYTVGLSLTTTILSWIIGNFIGLLAGFRKNKRASKLLEGIAICIQPIPYFLVALILQVIFAFLLGWFPLQATIIQSADFATYIASLIKASILPAVSILLLGTGWWIISMKSLSSATAEADFVHYARYRGLSEGKIGRSYVFRNSILTQVTALAMSCLLYTSRCV